MLLPSFRTNDRIDEAKRRHEAEVGKLRSEAANRDLALQDKVRQVLDVQQQLDNMRTALGDEQKKAERFQQLHCNAMHEVQELQQKVQVRASSVRLTHDEQGHDVDLRYKDSHGLLRTTSLHMATWHGLMYKCLEEAYTCNNCLTPYIVLLLCVDPTVSV